MLLDKFRFTAVLLSGGGRDSRGNPLPIVESDIPGCLLAPDPKSELDNLSEKSETTATLFFKQQITIPKNARIRTPEGSPIPGTWAVDGDPTYWPLGVEVNLRKES